MKLPSLYKLLLLIISALLLGLFVFIPVYSQSSFYNYFPYEYNDYNKVSYFLNRSVFILVFYLNFLVFVPKFLLGSKKRFYLFIFLGLLISIPIVCFFIRKAVANYYDVDIPGRAILFSIKLLPSLLGILVTSLCFRLFLEWINSQQQKKEQEEERVKSELKLLKSQINPHFLFNTLNNIRSLARKKSEDTEVAIVKLSQMMRYMMNETSSEKVFLENEIDYLKNYIDLQKIRLSNNTNVTLSLTEDTFENTIAPMLIIPFVENAFKHGVNSNDKSYIHIDIKINGDDFVLQVENSISRSGFLSQDETSGIGLKNVKGRLNLIYPHKHELIINEQPDKFSITLKINLA